MNQPDPQRRIAGGVEYELTRRRVRNLNIRVRTDGSVAVSAPRRVPLSSVDAFVAAHAGWVAAAQGRMAVHMANRAAEPPLPSKAIALHQMHIIMIHCAVFGRSYVPEAGTMCAVLPAVCRHLPARRNAPHSGAGHEHPVGELLPKNRNAVFCPAAVCDAAARAGVCGGTRVLPLCPPQPQPGFLGRRGQGDAGL